MKVEKKISVVINTYNAERHLQRVIDAVKGFDEILVCDMESTDSTLDIARRNSCRVITFEKGEHRIVEPARQYAIDHATYPWVLVVDADEIVTPALRDYLYASIEAPQCPAAIAIPRCNFFMGTMMHSGYPDYIVRFLRKDRCHWPAVIHASPEVNGVIEHIPSGRKEMAFIHLSNDHVADILRKNNIYSDYEVTRRSHKSYGIAALIYRPAFRFLKSYVLKRGFLDGAPGLIAAILDATYQFAIVAKLMERRHNKKP
jgi:glycosyltransferase involved in cell wall biosynthesis